MLTKSARIYSDPQIARRSECQRAAVVPKTDFPRKAERVARRYPAYWQLWLLGRDAERSMALRTEDRAVMNWSSKGYNGSKAPSCSKNSFGGLFRGASLRLCSLCSSPRKLRSLRRSMLVLRVLAHCESAAPASRSKHICGHSMRFRGIS